MDQGSQDLLRRLEEHLGRRRLFKPRQKVFVACSGGPDSVALFHLLKRLSAKYGWKLHLIHFNHRLRPGAAQADEKFVKALARKFRVPFYCGTGSVKLRARETKTSVEECARQMRYDFFLRTAKKKKIPVIALAHTRDDQAETVLMRLLQGTGLRGLQGIREKFVMEGATLVRPLLVFSKKELLSFLSKERLPFRSDKSNESSRFLRNRIRLELIPKLQRDYNPRVVEALSRIPAIVSGESALIYELEEKAWKRVLKKNHGKKVEFRRSFFLNLHPALQFRVMERALKKLDKQSGLSFEAWERLSQGLSGSRFRCSLPKDIDFVLTAQKVTLYKAHRSA